MSVHDEPFESPKPDKVFTCTADIIGTCTIVVEAVDLAEAKRKLEDGDYTREDDVWQEDVDSFLPDDLEEA